MAGKGHSIERDLQVLELRRSGMAFDAIATALGFANKGSACKAYHRALERARVPDDLGAGYADLAAHEAKKQLELDRLDRLQQGLWAKAARGDLGAVDRVLDISKQRARLENLYPPRNAAPALEPSVPRQPGQVVPASRVSEIRERRAREASERSSG
ncbi:hypothetical protein G7075_04340 [Phycicoccus sp. HDW14]|uniref:hypothetical protein n=1 Tax=Phycicoccus sp. HDW14 TaxID=2714941 RepID=UPI0014093B09|nr:hypothetical protein [Phycicoccus sp. HDW14]QIM20547.1 hypothetical protein G7075_04340 [Phycicoccus sp. HDW14]